MASIKKAITKNSKSHANDAYVVRKIAQAKVFIAKAGVPNVISDLKSTK
ncbi:hypothetical protein [Mucilaginibacter corticis]|nr:hypothetical protein [Mucilaginibacter corticis]